MINSGIQVEAKGLMMVWKMRSPQSGDRSNRYASQAVRPTKKEG